MIPIKLTAILILLFLFSVSGNANSFLIPGNDNTKKDFEASSTVSGTGLKNQTDSSNKSLRRKERHFGIGFHAFGPSLAYGSVYGDYSVTPLIELETGTDIRSFYGGFNLYPFAHKKDHAVTPYLGVFLNYTTNYMLYEIADAPSKGFKGYFPVGLQIFTNSGLIISPEIAFSTPEYFELSYIYFGMKVGYKFKNKK